MREEKKKLEEKIMRKRGVDDAEDWERMIAVRQQLDTIYEEKLQVVEKMYNMTQNFLKEQEIYNKGLLNKI